MYTPGCAPCRRTLTPELVSAVIFLKFLCTSVGAEVWDEELEARQCHYRSSDNDIFPYPYTSNEWFRYLNQGQPRPPPLIEDPRTLAYLGERGSLLERVYRRKFLLSRRHLRKSVSSHGNLLRLHLALRKLLEGKPITVVVLGGSITAGGDVYQERGDMDAYFGQVVQWINTTFPHQGHKFHNGGIPATGSSFFAVCTDVSMQHRDADLILLEFDINDSPGPGPWSKPVYMDNPWRRGLEVLMRKALQYPNHPAVIYVHLWLPGFAEKSFYKGVVEDESEVLVKYYGLQSISFRNMIYQDYVVERPGFAEKDFACHEYHPNYLGHTYIADMLIAHLQDQVVANIKLAANNIVLSETELPALPPPMIDNNYEAGSLCWREADLQQAAVSTQGWAWVDEPGRGGGHRFGYVSWGAGASLLLQVDSEGGGAAYGEKSLEHAGNTTIAIHFLHSYKDAGMGTVSCVSGCSCAAPVTRVDTNWRYHISINTWVYLGVSQSRKCVLNITNSGRSRAGEPKLKINAVAVLPFDIEHRLKFAWSITENFSAASVTR